MTAREKAIALFRRVYNDAEKLDEQTAADLVDAIIDAVRAPESAHTRALADAWADSNRQEDERGRHSEVGPANT